MGGVRYGFSVVVLSILVSGSVAWAQPANRGGVRLIVEDELGGVLVGAKATLVEVATQQVTEGVTDDEGRVGFVGLAPGEYLLTVESPGFRKIEQTLKVGAEPMRPMRLRMQIEVTEEVVDVVERRRQLIPPTAMNENADKIDFDDDLLRGAPLEASGDRLINYLQNFLLPAAGEPSIIVDGQEVQRLNLPLGAIDTLVVNKNPYSPEYRRPGRSRVEVVVQDGSENHYHGNVSFVFGDSSWDARNAFATTRPDTRVWLGEVGFAGPLPSAKGSYLFAGMRNEDRGVGVVNALTLDGPFFASVPEQQEENYALLRFDLAPNDRLDLTGWYEYSGDREINGDVSGQSLPELGLNTYATGHHPHFAMNTILSASVTNDIRVDVERDIGDSGRMPTGPQLVVLGAFRGGVNQNYTSSRMTKVEVLDAATIFKKRHTLRFGGRYRRQFVNLTNGSNFGGTFEFSNLDLFAAGRPYVYRVNQGAPDLYYSSAVGELFLQDEIKLNPEATLMLGARYDWESPISDHNNVAPRIAFAYAPEAGNRRNVIRAGAGIFYDRMQDFVYEQALMFDGTRTQSLVIANPSFPDPFVSGDASVRPPSLYQFDSNLRTPYQIQASVSLERRVLRGTMLTAEYTYLRSNNLFRTVNINAPAPGTGLRPDPSVLNVTSIQSSGRMRGHALTVTFRGRLTGAFKGTAVYTYSRTHDDVSGVRGGSAISLGLPTNSHDLSLEWGRADYDVRHRFSLTGLLELPLKFQIGPLLSLRSGGPFTITTGFDDNGDTVARDRPAGVPRNSGQRPGFARLDVRLTKLVDLWRPLGNSTTDPGELEISIDAINVLNRTNYESIIGVLSSPLFGLPNSAAPGRKIQLSIAYNF